MTGLLDNYSYWVNVIVRDGSGNKAVYEMEADTTVKHPRIYWTDIGSGKIQRSDLDGAVDSINDLVTTGLVSSYVIAVDPYYRKIYWTDSSNDKIQRSDFNGDNIEDVIIVLDRLYGIAVDYSYPNRYLYWTDAFNGKIYRAQVIPDQVSNANVYALPIAGLSNNRGIQIQEE